MLSREARYGEMKAFSIDEAERSLRLLAQRALRGEQVLIHIEGSSDLLSLRAVPTEFPQDYLMECYGQEEIAQENYLASLGSRNN